MAEFVDTNIWVYAHLAGAADPKSERARTLLGELREPVVSPQVLAEYSATMLRNRLPDQQVQENVEQIAGMCRVQDLFVGTVRLAWQLRRRYGFSYWDSQVLASALEAGCDQVYTEDLQHGQKIDGRLTVVNPFNA